MLSRVLATIKAFLLILLIDVLEGRLSLFRSGCPPTVSGSIFDVPFYAAPFAGVVTCVMLVGRIMVHGLRKQQSLPWSPTFEDWVEGSTSRRASNEASYVQHRRDWKPEGLDLIIAFLLVEVDGMCVAVLWAQGVRLGCLESVLP